MQIQDRIRELRRVPAASLRPNPRNWRLHPADQQDALRGILAEVGFAAALVVRELSDGTLEIIDGHLRAETAADALVPVLVLDVTEAEANKLLATFDPIGNMAGINHEALNGIVVDLDLASRPLKQLMTTILEKESPVPNALQQQSPLKDLKEKEIAEIFQVVIECQNEREQREIYERLSAEGYMCNLRTL
jgi:hypothetical protein